ncbi:MAG: Fe-S cluster assembly sulfur transfer protein SufU [Planctomycetota bacterium]
MSELRDLYQEVILDHSKRPRNFGPLQDAHSAKGHNPLCGDQITVHVAIADDTVTDVRFEGSGCAISTASASMMTEAVKGHSREEIEQIFERYHGVVTGHADATACLEALGKLAAFTGVSEFPVRVKCATLAWHTLRAAMEDRQEEVTTE